MTCKNIRLIDAVSGTLYLGRGIWDASRLSKPMRLAPATRRHAQRRATRADARTLALEVGAIGKREVALAVAPGEGAAGAGVAERFHALPHRHGIGFVVHEAVAHANPALRHDAIVFPYQPRGALHRGGTQ